MNYVNNETTGDRQYNRHRKRRHKGWETA